MGCTIINQDGSVLLNELAPRPHNSGHFTMEACVVDQFENGLRAVLGLPLGDGALSCGAAVMVNVLGEESMEETLEPMRKVKTVRTVVVVAGFYFFEEWVNQSYYQCFGSNEFILGPRQTRHPPKPLPCSPWLLDKLLVATRTGHFSCSSFIPCFFFFSFFYLLH
jgi:hypothetical protein